MTGAEIIEAYRDQSDLSLEEMFDAELNRMRDEMERAAIACSHGESNAARDILLKALGQ